MKSTLKKFCPWFVIILFILTGIISEIAIVNRIQILVVSDLRDISKVLLGVQATVAVLSLSIQALLGSFVDKTYWGISVSDFYSNKKNPYFTSLTAIKLTLVFLVLSFFSLLINKYNLLIMLFLATLFIIIYTTVQIFHVFKGENAVISDIKEMYNKNFEQNKPIAKKIELFKLYCTDWRNQITEQAEATFQEYENTFFNLFEKLIEEHNAECIKTICQMSKDLIKYLLTDSNEAKKKQGIKFLEAIYFNIAFLEVDISENSNFLKCFSLLSEVIQELLNVLKSISPQWLEDNFDWYSFIGHVDIVAYKYNLYAKNDELSSSLRIAIQMGIL